MKKIVSFLLTLCIVVGGLNICGVSVSAAETYPTIISVSADDVIKMPSEPVELPSDVTRASAPQVTKLEYFDSGIIEGTDHFGVVIKVTGYGNDYKRAYWDDTQLTINDKSLYGYWVGADNKTVIAFAYLYDCGPVTEAGVHTFKTTYTSTNSPYTQKSISLDFLFE